MRTVYAPRSITIRRASARGSTAQDGSDPGAMVVEVGDACLPSTGVASTPHTTRVESDVRAFTLPANVMMVQDAQRSEFDDASLDWHLRSAWFPSVFVQCQMGAPPMVIIRISRKIPVQRPLAEHDQDCPGTRGGASR